MPSQQTPWAHFSKTSIIQIFQLCTVHCTNVRCLLVCRIPLESAHSDNVPRSSISDRDNCSFRPTRSHLLLSTRQFRYWYGYGLVNENELIFTNHSSHQFFIHILLLANGTTSLEKMWWKKTQRETERKAVHEKMKNTLVKSQIFSQKLFSKDSWIRLSARTMFGMSSTSVRLLKSLLFSIHVLVVFARSVLLLRFNIFFVL